MPASTKNTCTDGSTLPKGFPIDFELVVNLESWAADVHKPRRALRLQVVVRERSIVGWKVSGPEQEEELDPIPDLDLPSGEVKLALAKNFEFGLPLSLVISHSSFVGRSW